MRIKHSLELATSAALLPLPLLLAAPADAAALDDKRPMICAPIAAHSCVDELECRSGRPVELNAPRFLRIDFAEKSIHSDRADGKRRATAVAGYQTVEDHMVLSGVDQGLEGPIGWTLVINRAGGEMTLAVAGSGVSLTLFGACTAIEAPPAAATGSSSR